MPHCSPRDTAASWLTYSIGEGAIRQGTPWRLSSPSGSLHWGVPATPRAELALIPKACGGGSVSRAGAEAAEGKGDGRLPARAPHRRDGGALGTCAPRQLTAVSRPRGAGGKRQPYLCGDGWASRQRYSRRAAAINRNRRSPPPGQSVPWPNKREEGFGSVARRNSSLRAIKYTQREGHRHNSQSDSASCFIFPYCSNNTPPGPTGVYPLSPPRSARMVATTRP